MAAVEIHAKDIPDQVICAFIRNGIDRPEAIAESLSEFPAKVVNAKIKQMINKGRLKFHRGLTDRLQIPLPAFGDALEHHQRNGGSK